jgi:hypothetical protein
VTRGRETIEESGRTVCSFGDGILTNEGIIGIIWYLLYLVYVGHSIMELIQEYGSEDRVSCTNISLVALGGETFRM